ncbi:hypothetical protein BDF21DRAFT_427544 [Thamnidium elegans]|uniref:Myb-like domain-containing protein n=1 Tax=Thamnidium elegans TaxID=101142 RepID=A0A8H7SVN5_9FUNG|nr:hypothetical protein INT48_004713 [Thamnidium elegans]KAI8064982.1 hypothetical protein BDF21DRAFT_427544 [Thamnidium elegans]
MDIKNLLCNTNEYMVEQYEKQAFEYYPTSPSSWSSASSISSESTGSFSPILSPVRTTKQHQTRTPWTSSEDYLLEKGYLQGLSWAMISSKYLPHRSRGCCWGRFKTLQTKSTEKKNWSESEDRVLIGAIQKHTRLFKQAWRSVALDLNERDWRECEIRSARISGLLANQKRQSLS